MLWCGRSGVLYINCNRYLFWNFLRAIRMFFWFYFACETFPFLMFRINLLISLLTYIVLSRLYWHVTLSSLNVFSSCKYYVHVQHEDSVLYALESTIVAKENIFDTWVSIESSSSSYFTCSFWIFSSLIACRFQCMYVCMYAFFR